MMRRLAVPLALFALPVTLAGCPAASPSGTSPGYFGSPEAAKGGLSGLVSGSVITKDEQELRDIQQRDTAMAFPVKIGVLFFEYRSELKAEDRQAAIDDARAQLLATGHVRDVFPVPGTFLTGRESLDDLRKLAARFQADVLLIVSGQNAFEVADDQSAAQAASNWFTTKTSYEARMTLTGLGLDVFAGTFMTPLTVAKKAGPVALDRSDASFAGERYKLARQAELDAFVALREQLAAGLAAKRASVQAAQAAAPSP